MDHFELVEKLSQKANVSYEDAKGALEVCEWDLLDALVYLEKQGKVAKEQTASYSTRPQTEPKKTQAQHYAGGIFQRLFDFFTKAIGRINGIELMINRKDKLLFSVPLLAVIILIIFTYWVTIPGLIISLFFGITYKFKGDKGVEGVNRVMDKAADIMDNIKTGSSKDHTDSET